MKSRQEDEVFTIRGCFLTFLFKALLLCFSPFCVIKGSQNRRPVCRIHYIRPTIILLSEFRSRWINACGVARFDLGILFCHPSPVEHKYFVMLALKSLNKTSAKTKIFEVAALVDRFCCDCQSCFFKRQFEMHFLLECTARQWMHILPANLIRMRRRKTQLRSSIMREMPWEMIQLRRNPIVGVEIYVFRKWNSHTFQMRVQISLFSVVPPSFCWCCTNNILLGLTPLSSCLNLLKRRNLIWI